MPSAPVTALFSRGQWAFKSWPYRALLKLDALSRQTVRPVWLQPTEGALKSLARYVLFNRRWSYNGSLDRCGQRPSPYWGSASAVFQTAEAQKTCHTSIFNLNLIS